MQPNRFAVSGRWEGEFDENALQQWAGHLRARLQSPEVSLGLVFMSPRFFEDASKILEVLRVHAGIPLLAGCSSTGLIADDREMENSRGLVLGLYALPEAELRATHITEEQVEQAGGPAFWHESTGVTPEQVNGWLVFADPFHLDVESWLKGWEEAYHGKPTLGGLASGDYTAQRTQVYLNGEVFEEGGVAIAVGGNVELTSAISQGCTPIGDTCTITKADGNFIHEIGNRPAYQLLANTFNQLSPDEQRKTQGNLCIGLVINEYSEDFHRGDFLIRNILGADPVTGSLAVGAFPRQGQTLQFQRRDSAAAHEDMDVMLGRLASRLGNRRVYGGCLCSCNGRGLRLFKQPNHDAQMVREKLGPVDLTGFFCNGELGPVGDRNFLHSFTASLALFTEKKS